MLISIALEHGTTQTLPAFRSTFAVRATQVGYVQCGASKYAPYVNHVFDPKHANMLPMAWSNDLLERHVTAHLRSLMVMVASFISSREVALVLSFPMQPLLIRLSIRRLPQRNSSVLSC